MIGGRSLVARVHGGAGSRVVILPDGSLGWPNALIETDEPFVPLSADEMARDLAAGPYRHFRLHRTDHYLVFYNSSPEFARDSGALLESLYRGLMRSFGDQGIEVRDAEFPLVAAIFRNETEFREHKDVAPDVQAYYEVISNRVFFFETCDKRAEGPAQAAMRKPQTVGHEGTHQILQNIGVQPRLARWPAWLSEGLAEYCSPAGTIHGAWAGCGRLNPSHLATLHELEDGPGLQARNPRPARAVRGRIASLSDVTERDTLTPTQYAQSWAFTHYLATRKPEEFVAYLKVMGQMPPMTRTDPRMQAHAFRNAFGEDPPEVGRLALRHVLSQKGFEPLPYYAVFVEQALGDEQTRRATFVSQSPLILRQWVEEAIEASDSPCEVRSSAFSTRAAAVQFAETWLKSQ